MEQAYIFVDHVNSWAHSVQATDSDREFTRGASWLNAIRVNSRGAQAHFVCQRGDLVW